MTTVPAALGTSALERFIQQLFAISEGLDKNQDGKISGTEWGAAAFELLMNFITNKSLTDEVRDLDLDEVTHLVNVVGRDFPNFPFVQDKVENVIRIALQLVATTVTGTRELFAALHDLKSPAPAKVAFVDNSNNPDAPSKAKWVAEPKATTKKPAKLKENPDAVQPVLVEPAVSDTTTTEQ